MNEELVKILVGMTKEQIIEEARKINLNKTEIKAFDKGKEYIDKMYELKTECSRKKVTLSLIYYGIIKERGGK